MRRSVRALTVLAVFAGCGQADAATGAPPRGATGTIIVGGEELTFRPAICSPVPREFTAAGRGRHDGAPFVVTVRGPGLVVVKFGVRDELARPAPGSRWLLARAPQGLQADGRRIVGSLEARDVRRLDDAPVSIRLDITCKA